MLAFVIVLAAGIMRIVIHFQFKVRRPVLLCLGRQLILTNTLGRLDQGVLGFD